VGLASPHRTQYSAVVIDESRLTHRTIDVGEVRLHCVFAGDERAPLVVLLHGFPELWYAWRRQIFALADAGFRVVAPDLRGYNLSDKPSGIAPYAIGRLAADIDGLVRVCGRDKAHVVGHDWGGGVAWMFAMTYPARLERLVILNSPHPLEMLRGLRRPAQLAKSWYMFFFQLPWLPERLMRAKHFAMLLRTLREDPLVPGAFDDHDLAVYAESYAQPGALHAMTNYYRAMMRGRGGAKLERVDAPVLILWGERDPHLGTDMATPDPKMVPNARVEFFPDASHWIQHERPERVNASLIEFLRGETRATTGG
jgi:pimeloyl-ACP methyl ester carboxylesterase